MIQHGTDWNRHHGVGSTLLENWVEERAVGSDTVQKEREDFKKLSRNGHKDILLHSKGKITLQSTHRDAYVASSSSKGSKVTLGKRRQELEAEILKQALAHVDKPMQVNASGNWLSTTKEDFAHTDIYAPVKKLGEKMPSKDLVDKFAHPITFWTDHAVKGSGVAICSTTAAELHSKSKVPEISGHQLGHRAGQCHQHDASDAAVSFGKHPGFTFPSYE